jgi:Tfp pilus assembly protein PilO
MIESLDLGTIITLVITAIATFAGGAWAIVKGKLKQVVNLARKAIDVATTLESALEDDKISKVEIEALKTDLAEVKGAWKELTKKE